MNTIRRWCVWECCHGPIRDRIPWEGVNERAGLKIGGLVPNREEGRKLTLKSLSPIHASSSLGPRACRPQRARSASTTSTVEIFWGDLAASTGCLLLPQKFRRVELFVDAIVIHHLLHVSFCLVKTDLGSKHTGVFLFSTLHPARHVVFTAVVGSGNGLE